MTSPRRSPSPPETPPPIRMLGDRLLEKDVHAVAHPEAHGEGTGLYL